MQKKPFVLISGPSGAGKTTLIQHILKEMTNLQKIVSYTTRPQRKDEKQGKSYFFVTPEEFFEKEKNKEFIEFACVYHNYYAVSKNQVEDSWKNKKIPIKDVDIQGLKAIKKMYPESFSVGIFLPQKTLIKERIEKRNGDFGENLKTRLESQDQEIRELQKEVDVQIINDHLEEALEILKKEIENYFRKM